MLQWLNISTQEKCERLKNESLTNKLQLRSLYHVYQEWGKDLDKVRILQLSQHNDSIMEFLKMQLTPTWTNRISQSKILWIQHSWLHFYTLTSVRYPVTIVSSTGSLICNPFNPSVHWAWTLLHFVPERW